MMKARALRALLVLAGAALAAAACDTDECAASIAVCGYGLSELTDPFTGATYTPVYDELLAEWSTEDGCRSAVKGSCDDGKVFLNWSGGFGAETFYFDADKFVGKAWTTDVGTCGRCPFSGFYGTPASVRCDNPQWEGLCGDEPQYGEPFLPFANGESPGICIPCEG